MKIAIAQINPIIGDFDYNFKKITEFARRAAGLSCDLVVFPELAVSGYPPRDFLERKDFVDANLACLNELIQAIPSSIGVICGFVDKNQDAAGNLLFNSAALFEKGRLLYKTHKRLLPTYDVFDERRYFESWKECRSFFYKGCKIGITICEDIWNDENIVNKRFYHIDPVALMIEDGADLIINISASPFHIGKKESRCKMLGSIAAKHSVPLIYANQVGGNDSVLFDGVSLSFDRHGRLAARALDFAEDMVTFDSEAQAPNIECNKNLHPVSTSETESVLKALIMGTYDYVTKCGFSKVVVGLSGGIDSALTAYIAVMALGSENVSVVFMPSRYTSRDNFEDTESLAQNLGLHLIETPIDGIFKEFLKVISPSFTNDPGITEQNIQARIRGTILMGFSNKYDSLLLTTGNKSEIGVGYCTLYGDMNGGLAVISDVPKTMAYEIARYINRNKEHIPLRIIEKAPSAELKNDQADQDDLPPYEILDPVLKGYIEDFKGVDELVQAGFDKNIVKDIITKIDKNEYKRQQAAPGLKVTSKAFGYGRRYPIAQRYKQSTKYRFSKS